MNVVGIDLHKKTISRCVVNQERRILDRKRFYCGDTDRILAFFKGMGPFQAKPATGHHQRGPQALALGTGAGRLAVGEQQRTLETHL